MNKSFLCRIGIHKWVNDYTKRDYVWCFKDEIFWVETHKECSRCKAYQIELFNTLKDFWVPAIKINFESKGSYQRKSGIPKTF